MKILAILGAIQGIVLFFFFLTIKKSRAANINMLIGIFLSIIQMLLIFYVGNPFSPDGPIFLKLLTRVLVFPIPVFFYFYFRFLIKGEKNYQKADLLHALPFLISIVFAFYPYLNIQSTKALLTSNDSLTFAQEGFYFLSAQSLLIILYAKLSYYSIFDLETNVWDTYAHLLQRELNWFSGAILSIFLVGFAGMFCSAFGYSALMQSNMGVAGIMGYIYPIFGVVSIAFYWVSYKAVRQPEIFRDLQFLTLKKEYQKYKHSGMRQENINQLAQQLIDLMEKDSLYLDPHLKLSDIAHQLGISDKILSQLINQHFQQNFYEFINTYRVIASKEKLIDPNSAHLSIQGIAIESGFKSKSTFYSSFKKQTGQTPSQFQKTVRK